MSTFKWVVAAVLLVGITLASGVLHGRIARRWGNSPMLAVAADRLAGMPLQFGDWELQSEPALSEYAETVLECSGYLSRVYRHRETGREVRVALVLGPAGPIATHRPEICYTSADREPSERRATHMKIAGRDHQLWCFTLEPRDEDALEPLRVYYGFSTGGEWAAPRDARWSYFGKPYLFKVQAAATLAADDDPRSDPCREFLEQFLTAVQPHLEPQK